MSAAACTAHAAVASRITSGMRASSGRSSDRVRADGARTGRVAAREKNHIRFARRGVRCHALGRSPSPSRNAGDKAPIKTIGAEGRGKGVAPKAANSELGASSVPACWRPASRDGIESPLLRRRLRDAPLIFFRAPPPPLTPPPRARDRSRARALTPPRTIADGTPPPRASPPSQSRRTRPRPRRGICRRSSGRMRCRPRWRSCRRRSRRLT